MSTELTVDTASPVPPYEQLRAQVVRLIEERVLTPGQRLPPVRQLAADLGLAAGTVARAYRELESAGQVLTRRGGGTRVAEAPPAGTPVDRDTQLAALAERYVAAARRLGSTDREVTAAVRDALR